MQETFRQVGELLLNAVPTVVLFLILYAAYKVLVDGPLAAVLAKRHALTQGAVDKARVDIAAAEAKTAEYEQKLREARTSAFKAQEARRKQALQARAEAVSAAREKAQAQVASAKAALEADKNAAQQGIEAEVERLAGQIVQAVLKPAAAGR
jgi:F-type H+-transporting ATPase subunit b